MKINPTAKGLISENSFYTLAAVEIIIINTRTCQIIFLHFQTIHDTIDIRRERDGKRYVNSIDDPRFGQCFLFYFLQPMLLASTRL